MNNSKGIIILFLVLTVMFPTFISEAGTEYTYSDWSTWQTTPISPSGTVEVETRVTNITETSTTTYFYEYWRYWNASANKYLYKGNGNAGGTYYSTTRTEKLNYYKDTSDGPSYLVGGGSYINFKGELWFNEKTINTPTVRQITEYRSRTKIESGEDEAPASTPPSPPTQTTGAGATYQEIYDGEPGSIDYVACSKSQYTENESIIISWSSAENANKYGLTVRISPYSGDSSIKYNQTLNGNSVNIGTLPPGSYRFAMRAYNSSGVGGPVSKIVYFTVSQTVVPKPELTQKPELTVKLDKQKYLSGETILISWNQVPNTTSYTMHVKGGYPQIDGYTSKILDTNTHISLEITGDFKIWVTSEGKTSSSPKSNEVSFTVADALISNTSVTVAVGQTNQLSLKYGNGKIVKSNLKWQSNNFEVASVDSNGLVTAKKVGNATIIFSINGKKVDSCLVNVTPAVRLPIDHNGEPWIAYTYTGSHIGTSFRAVDLNLRDGSDAGRNVYAIASGKVIALFNNYGEVIIEHDVSLTLSDGSQTYHKWYSLYAHMANIKVKKGDTVTQGTVLGTIWNTGVNDGNKHLHFAITTKMDTSGPLVNRSSDYNKYTISPLWVGGDYGKITYESIPSNATVVNDRLPMSLINSAPASN